MNLRLTTSFDPLAYDFARNEAELGGGIDIYNTTLGFQGGFQVNAETNPNFFEQTVAPILADKSPWGWIIILLAVLALINFFSND